MTLYRRQGSNHPQEKEKQKGKMIAEEGFLIAPCYSLELCIQMGITFLFSFAFTSLLLTAICKASSDNHFAFLLFFFLGMV